MSSFLTALGWRGYLAWVPPERSLHSQASFRTSGFYCPQPLFWQRGGRSLNVASVAGDPIPTSCKWGSVLVNYTILRLTGGSASLKHKPTLAVGESSERAGKGLPQSSSVQGLQALPVSDPFQFPTLVTTFRARTSPSIVSSLQTGDGRSHAVIIIFIKIYYLSKVHI